MASIVSSLKKNIISVSLVIIIIIMAITITLVVEGKYSESVTPPQICGDKALQYINKYLVKPNTSASLITVNEDKGMYRVITSYQSQNIVAYTTEDCTLLFPEMYNMSSPLTTLTPTPTPKMQYSRTEVPVVDLYVMAFCPYGTQAEAVMAPVKSLIGNKTNIRVKFITRVSGNTVASISSLHGLEEAKEDLRQAYIQANYPSVFWDYLAEFNSQCYPVWQNQTALDSCRAKIMADVGIDAMKIEAASQGSEGIALLKADATDAAQKKISASPTLIINGVTYTGARNSEAYRQAICNSFLNPPQECNVTLQSATAQATGNCG